MYSIIFILVASVSFSTSLYTESFVRKFGNIVRENNTDDDPGEPLILTDLIEKNALQEAKTASEVHHSDFLGVKSYSGYFTVNKQFNSNLFFWFFPAEVDYENAPVVLWLQGGPGGSSLFGLFSENGPFVFTGPDKLALREERWSKDQSVIYIDNPVRAGYSFTNDGGLTLNQTVIGEELYEALRQFFLVFPELQSNNFFISGESYAGKYVPAIAYTIHKKNPDADLKINLKGIAICDGLSDPIHQNQYSDFLYQIGLIDLNEKTVMADAERQMRELIEQKSWRRAAAVFNAILTLYGRFSGISNLYNYLQDPDPTKVYVKYLAKYVQRNDVRAALHVGNSAYSVISEDVYNALQPDIPKSVAPWISELLNHYRVLVFNGQVDVVVAYPLTANYLNHLDFNGADLYRTAERSKWYVDSKVAGYVKEAGNLAEVMVRNAGHMVPYDQPKWANDLIYRFLRGQKLYS